MDDKLSKNNDVNSNSNNDNDKYEGSSDFEYDMMNIE